MMTATHTATGGAGAVHSETLPKTDSEERSSHRATWAARLRKAADTTVKHTTKHTGVGLVCAVAYFDPGNWGVDLQAGSQFGYKLLFVVLLAGIIAVFWQVLASRLGCVTGTDLATHCRLLLYDRPKHTRLWRWGALYPLYVLSEVAIVATDLAELLGSAIALCMLIPSLPLWAGVLLTTCDVFVLLAIGDPLRGRPVKMFEWIIGGLVIAVMVCMAIIIGKLSPDWGDAFHGFIPSKQIFQHNGLYTSIGIIGATVMPHSLFLGSALSTQDRVSPRPKSSESMVSLGGDTLAERPRQTFARRVWQGIVSIFSIRSLEEERVRARTHADHENHILEFVRQHLNHGIVDIVTSLLGFAVVINSFILILASAVFYYGANGGKSTDGPASLFDAYDLIKDLVGKGAATLFALALLFSGQSSTIIATVAGQVVCEGFVRWAIHPALRRLLTRALGLIPSLIVAVAVGRDGIDGLLVVSQVVLSVCLPFVTFPLLWLTSSSNVMSVRRGEENGHAEAGAEVGEKESPAALESAEEIVSFANGRVVVAIGSLLWVLVVVANAYVLVTLAMGNGD